MIRRTNLRTISWGDSGTYILRCVTIASGGHQGYYTVHTVRALQIIYARWDSGANLFILKNHCNIEANVRSEICVKKLIISVSNAISSKLEQYLHNSQTEKNRTLFLTPIVTLAQNIQDFWLKFIASVFEAAFLKMPLSFMSTYTMTRNLP